MRLPPKIKKPLHTVNAALLLTVVSMHADAAGMRAGAPGYCQGYGLAAVESIKRHPTVTLGGTVVPFKQVALQAEVPGRVNFIAGEEGDTFSEGKTLVALDEEELRAQYDAAVTELRNAEAEIRNANVMYQRELWNPQSSPVNKAPGGMGLPAIFDHMMTRYAQDMAGQNRPWMDRYADIHSFRTRIEQAHNAHQGAQSHLRRIQAKLRDARSIAPFHGTIVRKHVEEGDTVQPGQPLLEFADMDTLQLEVDIPSRLMYRGLRVSDLVDARLDVGNRRPVPARVAQIYPMADPQRHTVKVKFDLRRDAPAAPGMYAEVMVPDPSARPRDELIIPYAAIIRQGGGPMVRVIFSNEPAKGGDAPGEELRLVRLGESVGRDYVSVLSGLNTGECVRMPDRGGR